MYDPKVLLRDRTPPKPIEAPRPPEARPVVHYTEAQSLALDPEAQRAAKARRVAAKERRQQIKSAKRRARKAGRLFRYPHPKHQAATPGGYVKYVEWCQANGLKPQAATPLAYGATPHHKG
jgi:hypothetical protein